MATHFAAIKDGTVIGIRSSASRSAEGGTGKFGLYTHAVMRTVRTDIRGDEGVTSSVTEEVISWHNGPANAAAGLKAAHVGAVHCYGKGFSSYVDDPTTRHGVRVLSPNDPETVRIQTYSAAELVPVVVTPRKLKVGGVL